MQCKVTQKKSQCFFLVCPKVRSWALFFSVSTCSHIWAVDIVVYSLNIMEIQYTEQQYSAFETVCHIHNRSWDMSRKMRMTWKVVAFSFLPMQTFLFPELLHRIKICREELISKMLQKTSKVHLMCTHIKCNLQTWHLSPLLRRWHTFLYILDHWPPYSLCSQKMTECCSLSQINRPPVLTTILCLFQRTRDSVRNILRTWGCAPHLKYLTEHLTCFY